MKAEYLHILVVAALQRGEEQNREEGEIGGKSREEGEKET